MEEKKKSLLNELEKMNPFRKKEKNEPKEEKIKDERIINENNEIISNMYCLLIIILYLIIIISDTLMVRINARLISISVGLVSYIGLILLCKKNAIEGNKGAFALFIWGIITFPCAIFNVLDDYIYKKIESLLAIILSLGGVIILTVLLYQIANIVYKKNNK